MPHAGRYALVVQLARTDDSATVEFALDGTALGHALDLRHADGGFVERTLDERSLQAGTRILEVRIVEPRRPVATTRDPDHFTFGLVEFGLVEFALNPLDAQPGH
ncbi:MAG: hypothetical protein H6837_14945 [Planctomycetes bacterium]|nr:hypothetical protein [Planctomycetota bacterium]